MRLHLLTPLVVAVTLAAVLSACTGPDTDEPSSGDPDGSAERTEQAALAVVRDAVPLAVRAIDGDRVRAEAGWTACMPRLSWRYDGAGVFKAPEREPGEQLTAIRSALVDAGFSDVTKVEGQVAVERDDVTLVFAPHLATGDPESWQVSFRTGCLRLSGEDQVHAESGATAPVDGLG